MSTLKKHIHIIHPKVANSGLTADSISTLKKHPHVIHPKEFLSKELKGIAKFNYWIAVKITNGVGQDNCRI